MDLLETLRIALSGLMTNKLRAALTALGIIIGVAAVIVLLAVGKGVQATVTDQVQRIGSNLITVIAHQPQGASAPAYVTTADADALADRFNVPALVAVAPEARSKLRVTRGAEVATLTVTGTVPGYRSVRNLEVVLGGFLTPADLDERARVAVLGWRTYTQLFPDRAYPLGETITISGLEFRVVGVLKEKGGMGPMGSEDERIYVPLTTAQTRLSTERTLSGARPVAAIHGTVADERQMEAAVAQVKALMRERHGLQAGDEDDFEVISQKDILQTLTQITDILTVFLGIVAGVSLLVGGIGIMNIMLVSVTERTREVGIRKAVGAVPTDIVLQFLLEALLLSLLGGLVGIGVGVVGTGALARLSPDLAPRMTLDVLVLAAGVASAVGLVFGVYPALRASRLRPIEALRYE